MGCMETPRPVSSVVTLIIITVSKPRSLNFYQRQSLKFTICLTFLKKGNSPWPIILQDLGSERLSQEFASDFPSFIFSTAQNREEENFVARRPWSHLPPFVWIRVRVLQITHLSELRFGLIKW